MHRSRIGLVLIDHPEENGDAALAFWAGVQGVTPAEGDADMPEYRSLGTIGSAAVWSQRTGSGTPPRVHLDIETDDGSRTGTTAALPFIDAQKKVPAA